MIIAPHPFLRITILGLSPFMKDGNISQTPYLDSFVKSLIGLVLLLLLVGGDAGLYRSQDEFVPLN